MLVGVRCLVLSTLPPLVFSTARFIQRRKKTRSKRRCTRVTVPASDSWTCRGSQTGSSESKADRPRLLHCRVTSKSERECERVSTRWTCAHPSVDSSVLVLFTFSDSRTLTRLLFLPRAGRRLPLPLSPPLLLLLPPFSLRSLSNDSAVSVTSYTLLFSFLPPLSSSSSSSSSSSTSPLPPCRTMT